MIDATQKFKIFLKTLKTDDNKVFLESINAIEEGFTACFEDVGTTPTTPANSDEEITTPESSEATQQAIEQTKKEEQVLTKLNNEQKEVEKVAEELKEVQTSVDPSINTSNFV